MLVAMIISWFVAGKKPYHTSHYNMSRWIIYLSDVAATNRQPIFICGSALLGIFFVWGNYEEYRLRSNKVRYLLPRYNKHATSLHILMIIFSIIASLGILMVSCFRVDKFKTVHMSFLAVFIFFNFLFVVADIIVYIIYYRHYRRGYFLSMAILKFVWAICAIAVVVLYGVFMLIGKRQGPGSYYYGYSGVMEWTICFWYGILMWLLAIDLRYPRSFDSDVEKQYR